MTRLDVFCLLLCQRNQFHVLPDSVFRMARWALVEVQKVTIEVTVVPALAVHVNAYVRALPLNPSVGLARRIIVHINAVVKIVHRAISPQKRLTNARQPETASGRSLSSTSTGLSRLRLAFPLMQHNRLRDSNPHPPFRSIGPLTDWRKPAVSISVLPVPAGPGTAWEPRNTNQISRMERISPKPPAGSFFQVSPMGGGPLFEAFCR